MSEGPDFSAGQGLLPVVVQDVDSGRVLMLAYMNDEAFRQTCGSGLATYYSRSRQRLWQKGEQSGHIQRVRGVFVDCDRDTILLQVEQLGPACHEGYRSCFFRQAIGSEWKVVEPPMADPRQVYGDPTGTQSTEEMKP